MDLLGEDLLHTLQGINGRAASQSIKSLVGGAMNSANFMFKIQRQLFARSERVKGIDFHPVEPWILTTLYSGTLHPRELEETVD